MKYSPNIIMGVNCLHNQSNNNAFISLKVFDKATLYGVVSYARHTQKTSHEKVLHRHSECRYVMLVLIIESILVAHLKYTYFG